MGNAQIAIDELIVNLLLIVGGILVLGYMILAIVEKRKVKRPPFSRAVFTPGTRFKVNFNDEIFTAIDTDIDIRDADSFKIIIEDEFSYTYVSSYDVTKIL